MFYRNYVHRNNLFGTGLIAFLAGAVAWAMFGKKVTDELNTNPDIRSLKRQIYRNASMVTDLTREKYDEIVDDVSRNYAKIKNISENELVDLMDDLKMNWSRMKDAWNE